MPRDASDYPIHETSPTHCTTRQKQEQIKSKNGSNICLQQTHCNIQPKIRMIHVPNDLRWCFGILSNIRVTHFVMHLRLRLLSNYNIVIVCCRSVAFGRCYVLALCACLLLLLLLSFCLPVGLIASTAKSPFTSFFHHPFHPPLSHISPFNNLCIHEIGHCNICFLSRLRRVTNYARTPHTHYAPDSFFFSSHFSTLIAKGAHA